MKNEVFRHFDFWLKCGIIVLQEGGAKKDGGIKWHLYGMPLNAKSKEKTSIFYICKKVTVR